MLWFKSSLAVLALALVSNAYAIFSDSECLMANLDAKVVNLFLMARFVTQEMNIKLILLFLIRLGLNLKWKEANTFCFFLQESKRIAPSLSTDVLIFPGYVMP